ncbi:MAG TPA: DUF4114 domain-containing protein [Woeseiaceae bacterium]|nr:DUF4114 domain-containing protein [Woeseiaceae bacterium]
MLHRLFAGLAVFFAGTTLAHATLINTSQLQDQLDARTRDGEFQNVNEDQAAPDELWTLASINNGTAMIMFELAGNAGSNSMGIYDPYNTSNTLELFAGLDGSATKIGLIENDGLVGTCAWSGWGCTFTGNAISLTGGTFGFYLDVPEIGSRFYSQSALNTDAAADGTTDHLVAFAGDGSDDIDPLLTGDYGIFAPGEYIIAWEDLRLSDGDRNYSDMVVLMESIVPVPEPGPLALLGAALVALGLVRIKASRRVAAIA